MYWSASASAGRVVRRNEPASFVVHELRNAAYRRRDDRQSRGERLYDDTWEVVEAARQDEEVSRAHHLGDHRLRLGAVKGHLLSEAQLDYRLLVRWALGTVSDHVELPAQACARGGE